MRKLITLSFLALLVVSCGDSQPTDPLGPGAGSDLISDANQNDGNKAFFWLAPIVKDNLYMGEFNARLRPRVVICEVDVNATPAECPEGSDLVAWTLSTGLSVGADQYQVNWDTDTTPTNFDATYRIQVFLTEEPGSERLGFADVQFFSGGKELKNINTDETIALTDGRTLPVKFRVEVGASCGGETDCTEATIGSGGGTLITPAGLAGVEVPAGAVDGDVLFTIRHVDPASQPWGRCLPTGLRQEEGCYEFDTQPKLDEFNLDVLVDVCIVDGAVRPENLVLHRYDDDVPTNGVVALEEAGNNLLACGDLASSDEGAFMRFARAAGRLLSPIARLVGGTPLYATDTGRAGLTKAFSFIGWAEPLDLSVTAPDLLAPGATVPVTVDAATAHNDPGVDPVAATGHLLRAELSGPGTTPTSVLDSLSTSPNGQVQPQWVLSQESGLHVMALSTQLEIMVDNEPVLIPDPTGVVIVQVAAYDLATACEGEDDCVVALVGTAGDTIVTPAAAAGVIVPQGAVDGPIAIKINRLNAAEQDGGRCLPTGLRQVGGCYEYDTEPALSLVNQADEFNVDVAVQICMDPDPREDYLRLHKYDPDYPQVGVVELAPTSAFLSCQPIIGAAPSTALGRLASAGRQILDVLVPPLYATDAGRAGLTKAFSRIGWAEPVTLTLAFAPVGAASPTEAVVTATTSRNSTEHPATVSNGTTIRFEYTDPSGAVTVSNVVTDESGEARITLGTQPGDHTVRASTSSLAGNASLVPDPTGAVESTVTIGLIGDIIGSVRTVSGAPLVGATVTIASLNLGTTTNANGDFQLLGVPAGPQSLTVGMSGYSTAQVQVTVPDPDVVVVLTANPVDSGQL